VAPDRELLVLVGAEDALYTLSILDHEEAVEEWRCRQHVGTLYRHSPTRDALIAVLIQERLERLGASAEAVAKAGDAWAPLKESEQNWGRGLPVRGRETP